MTARSPFIALPALVLSLAVFALAGCSGGSSNNGPLPPAVAPTSAAAGCIDFPYVPLLPTPVAKSGIIDVARLTIPSSKLPPGFVKSSPENPAPKDLQQELRNARALAEGSRDPEAAYHYLIALQFNGARQQQWNGAQSPTGAAPNITVQHVVFSASDGASRFLHDPVVTHLACVNLEQGPSLGQESQSLRFTASLPINGVPVSLEGHAIFVRCGRTVLYSSGLGDTSGPGRVTQGMIDDVGHAVLSQYKSVYSC